jgi:hypothetical protein
MPPGELDLKNALSLEMNQGHLNDSGALLSLVQVCGQEYQLVATRTIIDRENPAIFKPRGQIQKGLKGNHHPL